jgi:hypothetical protein
LAKQRGRCAELLLIQVAVRTDPITAGCEHHTSCVRPAAPSGSRAESQRKGGIIMGFDQALLEEGIVGSFRFSVGCPVCAVSRRSATSLHARAICRKIERSLSLRALRAQPMHSSAFSRCSFTDDTYGHPPSRVGFEFR